MFWHRIRQRAKAAAKAAEFQTDARRLVGGPGAGREDPEIEWRMRWNRRVVGLLLAAIFLAGGVAAVFGRDGYVDLRSLRAEQRELENELDRRREAVLALKRQVRRLEVDPTARERIAREKLGYVRPGEYTFLLPLEENEGAEGEVESPDPAP